MSGDPPSMEAAITARHGAGWYGRVSGFREELRSFILARTQSPGLAAATLVEVLAIIVQTTACQRDTEEETRDSAERLAADRCRTLMMTATDPEKLEEGRRVAAELRAMLRRRPS